MSINRKFKKNKNKRINLTKDLLQGLMRFHLGFLRRIRRLSFLILTFYLLASPRLQALHHHQTLLLQCRLVFRFPFVAVFFI